MSNTRYLRQNQRVNHTIDFFSFFWSISIFNDASTDTIGREWYKWWRAPPPKPAAMLGLQMMMMMMTLSLSLSLFLSFFRLVFTTRVEGVRRWWAVTEQMRSPSRKEKKTTSTTTEKKQRKKKRVGRVGERSKRATIKVKRHAGKTLLENERSAAIGLCDGRRIFLKMAARSMDPLIFFDNNSRLPRNRIRETGQAIDSSESMIRTYRDSISRGIEQIEAVLLCRSSLFGEKAKKKGKNNEAIPKRSKNRWMQITAATSQGWRDSVANFLGFFSLPSTNAESTMDDDVLIVHFFKNYRIIRKKSTRTKSVLIESTSSVNERK